MPNILLKLIGGIFIILNKIRHEIQGYQTPRAFSVNEIDRAVNYDFEVVNSWLKHLGAYINNSNYLFGKNILELGPGADLGVGLILLAKGAKKYNAVDVNNLVKNTPSELYSHLFDKIQQEIPVAKINFLTEQLSFTKQEKNDCLNYLCKKDFDLSILQEEKIDLVFSQAAFEHFNDIPKTISQISKIVNSGGILITEIDLKTHTRWLRDKDPNNIYRFSDYFYNLFKFLGSPNRMRPYQYKKILEQNGWENIQIIPLVSLIKEELNKTKNSLNKKFRDEQNQMEYLSIMLMATKK